MPGKLCVLRNGFLLATLLLLPAAACMADAYSNQGVVYLAGVINSIDNQQTCHKFGCQVGDHWALEMAFTAADWNAPGSNYMISAGNLNCFGGPPCIDNFHASSNFGWSPFYFDDLSIQIQNGKIVDVRASAGNYFIEWGFRDRWLYWNGFSGTTISPLTPATGPLTPTPEPDTLVLAATGLLGCLTGRNLLRLPR